MRSTPQNADHEAGLQGETGETGEIVKQHRDSLGEETGWELVQFSYALKVDGEMCRERRVVGGGRSGWR